MELHAEYPGANDAAVDTEINPDHDTEAHTVNGASVVAGIDAVRHAAETGGGPTGFGWASFVTFAVGAGVVLYSAGQLMKAVHARRTESAAHRHMGDGHDGTAPGATQSAAP